MYFICIITEIDMRNLDLSALRALHAVAELGGVTKAAHQLNLTQSAISMQLKRLEDSLDKSLLAREGKKISLTAEGKELVRESRKLLALNDAIFARFSQKSKTGNLRIGITSDVTYFGVSKAIKGFADNNPHVLLDVRTGRTVDLKRKFQKGDLDLILTTEFTVPHEAGNLLSLPLAWFGAIDGEAWTRHPLPLGINPNCAYRTVAEEALDKAGIEWHDCHIGGDEYGNDILCAADIGVNIFPKTFQLWGAGPINHAGKLPPLPDTLINAYITLGAIRPAALELVDALKAEITAQLAA